MLKEVNILWTGGWDSTFRIMRLSEMNVVVQPFYISDNRKCEKYEIKAIMDISKRINDNKHSKCVIKPLVIEKASNINPDASITAAFNAILLNDFIGSQYEWLARFSKAYNGLELCIHIDDKACNVIKKHGLLKEIEDVSGKNYTIDPRSSMEILEVFGNFHFPILDVSKLDMKKKAVEAGFIDIMNMTWFCHTPINGSPCGICNPCSYTIEEGLAYRFSSNALLRNKFKAFFILKRKVFNKFKISHRV